MSLRLEDLHAIYGSVSREEAIMIANLGAICHKAAKDNLFALWNSAQNDSERADICRKEGATAMLESLKCQLAEGDAAKARVAWLESMTDAEMSKHVDQLVSIRMKEMEIAKLEEIGSLKEKVAEARGIAKSVEMLEEAHSALKSQIASLREENDKLKEATVTKSSSAIGKIGEETVKSMLDSYVSSVFPDIEVFDKTKVKHSGDFHVHIMGKHGKIVRVMIDVKKYKSAIDSTEIQKLYSDLDACDVDVGLMLSLDSGISTKSQFHLAKTKGNKLCMFLSFEKLDDGIRKEILCWAIRVLVGIVATQDHSKQDVMVAEIQHFLVDMLRDVDKLDSIVRSTKGVYDLLRDLKEDILSRITSFKTTCGMEAIDTIVESRSGGTITKVAGQCQAIKPNGEQCKVKGKQLIGDYCKYHAPKDDVISIVE